MTDDDPGRRLAPGSGPRRRLRPAINWELIGCALHGHHLVGTDAATVTPADHMLVRTVAGAADGAGDGVGKGFGEGAGDGATEDERWYRCLRCDAWVALPPPARPQREAVPGPDDIEVPLRGRPLRDRYVLRIVAVERATHIILLGLLAAAVFLFAAHQKTLRGDYTRILNDLQQVLGGPVGHHGIVTVLDRLFSISTGELYLIGTALVIYCILLGFETVGLWFGRRWAEYLTFVETGILVPYELYELANGPSALKVLSLAINLAILFYLALVHRLFRLRGGLAAVEAMRTEASGWETVARATPPALVARAGEPGPPGAYRRPS